MSLTHGYVFYVVAMHNEGAIYSRQCYSLTSLILSLLSDFVKPDLLTHTKKESQDHLHVTFDHRTSVQTTSYACSLAYIKGDYSLVCSEE